MKKQWMAGVAAASLVLMTTAAFAQGTGVKTTQGGGKDDDYGYEFSDEPSAAGGFEPGDEFGWHFTGPVRTTLIRPRTSFEREMLKGVEKL